MKKSLFILSLLSLTLNAKPSFAGNFLGMFNMDFEHAERPAEETQKVRERISNMRSSLATNGASIRAENKEKAQKLGEYHKSLNSSLNEGELGEKRAETAKNAAQEGEAMRQVRGKIRSENQEKTNEKIQSHKNYMTENADELEMQREEQKMKIEEHRMGMSFTEDENEDSML